MSRNAADQFQGAEKHGIRWVRKTWYNEKALLLNTLTSSELTILRSAPLQPRVLASSHLGRLN